MIYDSRCNDCERLSQYVSKIEHRHIVPACPYCGGDTRKVIVAAPMGYVKGNFETFRSPVDGSLITGARALAEHNRRNNVVNINDGYSEEKVIAGDLGHKPVVPDKKEIAADLAESLQKVKDGYKPVIGEANAPVSNNWY